LGGSILEDLWNSLAELVIGYVKTAYGIVHAALEVLKSRRYVPQQLPTEDVGVQRRGQGWISALDLLANTGSDSVLHALGYDVVTTCYVDVTGSRFDPGRSVLLEADAVSLGNALQADSSLVQRVHDETEPLQLTQHADALVKVHAVIRFLGTL